ncbi:hypothetical protein [Oceaniradius stylonematis]|uniref:hypothetical protein n=1 Tax=Oceaniradius stylonematis TaxID=2184161 RepID=UPI00273EE4B4|nr:hypothetical protein [Oceaniradius stylonematis]
MIVYCVGRRFFSRKRAAEQCCRDARLPFNSVYKITITHRDELAAFLDALCEPQEDRPSPLPHIDVQRDVPDCVPDFLRKSWGYS